MESTMKPSDAATSSSPEGSPPRYTDDERSSLTATVDQKAPLPTFTSTQRPPLYPQQPQMQQQQQQYPQQQPTSVDPTEMGPLAYIMNLLFFLMGGGVITMIVYLSFALLCAFTVVGWPVAVDLFRIGMVTSFPYGRQVVAQKDCNCKRVCLQTLWFPFGLCVYFLHLALSVMYMLSLVFIPFGLQHFALAKVGLWPFAVKVYNRNLSGGDLFSVSYYVSNTEVKNQAEIHV